MVFWGVEIRPGKPYTYIPSGDQGSQLHISQATLGINSKAKERNILSVKVGDSDKVLICSLTYGSVDSSSLDLIFDEEAVFEVEGPSSIHLSGYYMPISGECDHDHEQDGDYEDDEFDSDDEDEDWDGEGDEFADEIYDSDDEYDEDGHFIDGDAAPKSNVIIEEITDDKAVVPVNSKKKGKKDKSAPVEAEEDEDGFEIEGKGKRVAEEPVADEIKPKKKQAVEVEKKAIAVSEPEPKKLALEEVKEDKVPESVPAPTVAAPEIKAVEVKEQPSKEPEENTQEAAGKKKKKKNKAEAKAKAEPAKTTEPAPAAAPAAAAAPKKAAVEATAGPKPGAAVVRKFSNGLEVHEVKLGKPNGKLASVGKKVSMHYTGRLKSNRKQFDSSIGKKPFLFRLGVGEVIKGWDVGVQGMRVGDKRKLIIPPAMGYGSKGAPPTIPGNAWLEFDIELIDVK